MPDSQIRVLALFLRLLDDNQDSPVYEPPVVPDLNCESRKQ